MLSIRFYVQAAFKEWAAVCEALAVGRQTIILRKGGINEGRDGFRVEHGMFFLYPTNFHQAAESLTPDAGVFVQQAMMAAPDGSSLFGSSKLISLRLIALVAEVHELTTEADALRLNGFHIWSEDTVRARFAYRRPGLFLLIVNVFELPQPVLLEESDEMAGCKSWVSLPNEVEFAYARPVLTKEEFETRLAAIHQALVA